MLNLLNAVSWFGHNFDWNSRTTIIVLIVLQAIIAMFVIALIIYLILRPRTRNKVVTETVVTTAQPEEEYSVERVLMSISLDLGVVQREFTVDESFNCEGIIIHAEYNTEPTWENYVDYEIVDERTYARLEKRNKTRGCYVVEPDMSEEGKKTVIVHLGNEVTLYTINVVEAKEEAKEEPQQLQAPAIERTLLGISVDIGVVQREFNVGDQFNCSGIVINADYNLEPTSESYIDYSIVDSDTYTRLENRNRTSGCYVVEPDMSKEGKKVVFVRLGKQVAIYTIAVHAVEDENPVVESVPEVIEPAPVERILMGITLDLGVVQREFVVNEQYNCAGLVVNAEYNLEPTSESYIDFTVVDSETFARLENSQQYNRCYVIIPDMAHEGKKVVFVRFNKQSAVYTISVNAAAVEQPVEEPKRKLLYITLDADKVQNEYIVGDAINHEGLVVYGHFDLEPATEEITEYTVIPPDMTKVGRPTVTVMYQDKTVGYPITVNADPNANTVVEQEQTTVFVKHPDPIIIEEEEFNARLRYDKSFTARLIQSEDEIKFWYTELKNELLSFKKVKGRISWKRETFKAGHEMIAKLAYRGKTLCMFLPLNPDEYGDDTKYNGERATEPVNEDTPLLMRLKNHRRVKLAIELLHTVLKDKGIERLANFEAIDYYIPYEGVLDLIKKGLIKREVKTPEDEAIFERDKLAENPQPEEDREESFGLQEVAPGIYVTQKDKIEKAN